jgi:hypothetical protein
MLGATLILLINHGCLRVFMALLNEKNKSGFWDSLLNEGKDYYGPWFCIGDFNMNLSQSESMEVDHLLVLQRIHFIAFWILLVWLI